MTAGVALLDVNVLIALAWPNHEGHRAARTWFSEHAADGWATTPVTETGFVRVSSNRRVLPTATTPAIAVQALEKLRALPAHAFWPDDVQLVTGGGAELENARGHGQVTDAHLVAIARTRNGRLVTFDRGPSELPGGAEIVHLLTS